MQLRAKQDFTYNGMAIQAGQTFEASDEEANKLVSDGKAEKVEEQGDKKP